MTSHIDIQKINELGLVDNDFNQINNMNNLRNRKLNTQMRDKHTLAPVIYPDICDKYSINRKRQHPPSNILNRSIKCGST